MTDEEYIFHETSRERKRNGVGDFSKRRQGGKHVHLSSDNLSRKEWEKMNGEVITFELDQPRSWQEYIELPDHVKIDYLLHLQEKYNAGPSMIGSMMGMSRSTVENEINRLKVERKSSRGHRTGKQMEAWGEFLNVGYVPKPKKQEVEKDFENPTSLAELLSALSGTGAKITIELTL